MGINSGRNKGKKEGEKEGGKERRMEKERRKRDRGERGRERRKEESMEGGRLSTTRSQHMDSGRSTTVLFLLISEGIPGVSGQPSSLVSPP